MTTTKQLTLVLLHHEDQVLLGMKKRGFGIGKFNGFGGKVEPGETILQAAVREMQEEAGVLIRDPEYSGHIIFKFEGQAEILEVHVFRATVFEGEPVESEEMKPQWFPATEIPFDSMWLDDRHWLPLLLSARKFTAEFLFEGQEKILSHTITDVAEMPISPDAVLVTSMQAPISIV